MKMRVVGKFALVLALAAFSLCAASTGHAIIQGLTDISPNPTFQLTAKQGHIITDDGNSLFMWGFANGAGPMQYPGPTLIVNQGAVVTVILNNQLSLPVSIVFPGQGNVIAAGGIPGTLAREAPAGGSVTYTFTALNPGTYIYHSGSMPELQVEMGLVGALIVRPSLGAGRAYNHPDTIFDREYLFLLSEADPVIHRMVERGLINEVDNTKAFPVYWFINGRAGVDTLADNFSPFFPNQPYSAVARMHPNEKVLVRMIGAGRDLHPFHLHGNHHSVIAKDGRLLTSTPDVFAPPPDLHEGAFTTTVAPGDTVDAFFTWTGEGVGWDLYGHIGPAGETGQDCVNAGVPLDPNEPLEDHCKPLPVDLPQTDDLTFGIFWSGSPFLGSSGNLPPGEGGFNPSGGLFFMWHSHSEKEITSNNIFPGGMLTFAIVEHPMVPIP